MSDRRLLIMEPDPGIAATIHGIAQDCGFALDTVANGAAFLDRLAGWQPTVVMLDLQMLAADGGALLRSLSDRLGGVAVIVAGHTESRLAQVARLLASGLAVEVAGTLVKPLRSAELRRLLERQAGEAGWCTEQALLAAIENQELFLLYQPKIGLRDGRVIGYEALLRWRHSRRGVVTPEKFIPFAEGCGLIGRITDLVIEHGLRDAVAWGGTATNSLAINLSGRDLQDATFADRLSARCVDRRIDPTRLVLELTEASAMADSAEAIHIMTRLRLKGFRLSIDDFGTGHSSLLQLARLPFSELKIDKTFVIEANTSPEARVIIKSTVDLAHNLGLRTVAEGVENAEARHLVGEMGCDVAQGYHIGRPMPATQIDAWLAGQPGTRPNGATDPLGAAARPRREPQPHWSKAYDRSETMRHLLNQSIAHRLNPLWGLGRNVLMAWRPVDTGIEALMMPYQAIMERFSESKRLLHGQRLMGDGTFREVVELSGTRPVPVSLPFRIADDDLAAVPSSVVEQALRRYGIPETPHRAAALFDIVDDSDRDPQRQAAQLDSLEDSITQAVASMHELGKPIDLLRTVTDTGCYIWNRKEGADADLDTYLLTLLTVANSAIALREQPSGTVPQIRACFSVGPHYSYDQVEAVDPHGRDHMVGDVTTGLARMVAKCLPGQILIGDFRRPTEAENEPTNPLEFVVHADGMFARYDNVRLHGQTVTGIRCYLTGEARDAGQFDVTRFRIRDRDGFDHHVFNQKFNVYLTGGPTATARVEPLYLGKQKVDLTSFEVLETTPLNLPGTTVLPSAAA